MGSSGKSFALILVLIMAISSLSLLVVKQAFAQTPTPIFSVSITSGSYVVPTTYSTSPYNGATVTNLGYTVDYFNINVNIQNSPTAQFYLLQYKGHYTSEWSSFTTNQYPVTTSASSGSQTIITFWGNNSTPLGQAPANKISLWYSDSNLISSMPLGSQIDFRLQAINGSINYTPEGEQIDGSVSDWSAAQTVTIPNEFTSTSGSPSPPTSTPVAEFPTLIILPLFAVMILLSIAFVKKRISVDRTGSD